MFIYTYSKDCILYFVIMNMCMVNRWTGGLFQTQVAPLYPILPQVISPMDLLVQCQLQPINGYVCVLYVFIIVGFLIYTVQHVKPPVVLVYCFLNDISSDFTFPLSWEVWSNEISLTLPLLIKVPVPRQWAVIYIYMERMWSSGLGRWT